MWPAAGMVDAHADRPGTEPRRGGACERHLLDAVARWAPLSRAAVIGLAGTFGLAGYGADTLPVAVVMVFAGTVLPCLRSRFGTVAPAGFLLANVLVSVLIGLSQVVLGAEPVSGWIVAAVSITSVTCYFEWPDRRLAPHGIAVATIAAYGVGCALAGGVPVATCGRLVVQSLLSWAGLLAVRRAARMCDELVHRAVQRRMAAAADRAARSADRAYLALLHDTASTTFLMVSTNATRDFDWLSAQAGDDLEALATHASAADGDVDLAALLASLAAYRGLAVDLAVPDALVVPAKPAFAIYHGVREALGNVSRHAGDPNPALSAHDRAGDVVVEVCDRGRGFDTAAVPAHRRGLSESIHARMADAGGRTEVRSAPGQGTTVRWTWSRD